MVPQVLLSGIIFPVSSEPRALQYVSNVLPLTYAVYGMRDVMLKGSGLTSPALLLDALIVLGFCVLLIGAAGATLRRRIA
jgi:ABC-2 type transport system permease protein